MIKLLVVEDDKVLSNNIKEILAAIGEITQVYDGSEGLFELESGVYDQLADDFAIYAVLCLSDDWTIFSQQSTIWSR